MRRGAHLVLTLTFLAAGVAMAGCTGQDDLSVAPAASPMPWKDVLNGTLKAARRGGASPEQLALMEDGEVSFGEYQTAVGRTATCLTSSGISVIGDTVTNTRGFPEISYSYAASSPGRSDDETDSISQACISSNSEFVESLYAASPAAVEAQDAAFKPYRPVILSCLRRHGASVKDDIPRDDISLVVINVMDRTGTDCFAQAKYRP